MNIQDNKRTSFQFTDEMMLSLRSGDKTAIEGFVLTVYRNIDQVVRSIYFRNFNFSYEDCKEIAHDFIADRLLKLCDMYKNESAEIFSAKYNTALTNYVRDVFRKRKKTLNGSGMISLDESIGGVEGDSSWYDVISDSHLFQPEKVMTCYWYLHQISQEILHFTKNKLHQWILAKSFFNKWKTKEIAEAIPRVFPGENYAPGSIDSLVFRFRATKAMKRLERDFSLDMQE